MEQTYTSIEQKNKIVRLQDAQRSLHRLVKSAHYGLVILRSSDWIIEIANDEIANLAGKPLADLIGRPLLEILPEIKTQPYYELLKRVFETGIPYAQDEEILYLETPEGQILKYVSFYYDPLFDDLGAVSGIIVSVENTSDKVLNRQLLQNSYQEQQNLNKRLELKNEEYKKSEEMLRMSVESAQFGTWFMNLQTMEFTISSRQRELYGYHAGDEITVAALMHQITEEFRGRAQDEFKKVIKMGGLYNTTSQVIGYHDRKLRWVKSSGSVIADENGKFTYFSGVSIEITAQKEDELRKDHFIDIVSHELKTPLTSLKGYVQLLQHRAEIAGDEFMSLNLGRADNKLDKMTSLINGFLNIHQLESGRLKMNFEVFDMSLLIKITADETNLRFRNSYVAYLSDGEIFVNADREKISQVLVNLLDNAHKYAGTSGKIEIETFVNAGLLTVSVKDYGIGISEQDQLKIFERYYRAENFDSNFISGFGIGLYLCYEVITRHDGNIWVKSLLGEGSTFSFSLAVA